VGRRKVGGGVGDAATVMCNSGRKRATWPSGERLTQGWKRRGRGRGGTWQGPERRKDGSDGAHGRTGAAACGRGETEEGGGGERGR
jgi:hypothetical protein